jgi:3-deoxy-D-manno-octulosonic-acid transferase
MYFLYSLLLTLGFLILSPRFLFDALRHGKYVAGFRERLGILPPQEGSEQPVIWVHCVSVGETQAARPLVKALKQKFPHYRLVVSTITATGQRLAREIFQDSASRVFYFPFDWRFSVRRMLRQIDPSLVLLMETELWPRFVRECARQKVPVVLVSGRISERSCRRYRLIKPFIRRVLSSIQIAVMQTEEDAERLRSLGMKRDRVFVSGSLKFDAGLLLSALQVTEDLRKRFDSPDRPLLLAASTHAPEERLLIEAYKQLQADLKPRPRLMIAPRHPERFAEVAALMATSGLSWTKRSQNAQADTEPPDLILLDSIGELTAAFPLASIVFVGGSIPKQGGHNILEPAAVGCCIVTGANTQNFASIVNTFVDADAIIQMPPLSTVEAPADLANLFRELLANPKRQEELKRSAKKLVAANIGATDRTIKLVAPFLRTATPTEHPKTTNATGAHSA